MSFIKFTYITLTAIAISFANLEAKADVEYTYQYYQGFGISGGVHGWNHFGFESGLAYNKILIGGLIGGGYTLKSSYEKEFYFNTDALKIGGGIYGYVMFYMLYLGLNEVNYFHEGTTYACFRPEIGYGMGLANITYARNLAGKNTTGFISRNLISLNFFIPVKNKKIPAPD